MNPTDRDRVEAFLTQRKPCFSIGTIADLPTEIQVFDPALASKVYLLEDCTSPVVVPAVIDFTEQADAAYQRFAEAGMHLVQSTNAIANWKGMTL